jgi:hypothetical protein
VVGCFRSCNFRLLSFYHGDKKIQEKRKIYDEKRAFNSKWEAYFSAE